VSSLPNLINDDVKNGSKLAGDDLGHDGLEKWYREEENAYFEYDSNLAEKDPWYGYMRYTNSKFFFSEISKPRGTILFVGPGSGIEVESFSKDHKDWSICFLESSRDFQDILKHKFPNSIILESKTNGSIPIDDNSIDVVCVFSVLHHIANVSHYLSEFNRVLENNGSLFIREPCSSMGNWRGKRSATPNERGISKSWFLKTCNAYSLKPYKKPIPLIFEPINKILSRIGLETYNYPVLYFFDRFISLLLSSNDHYWRDKWYKKIGPSSYLYFFRKSK